MERALELALDRADDIIESVQRRPPERKYLSSGEKSISQKLYDLYVEECGKEPEVTQDLRSNVNLLEKLVTQERLPCLVVSLYPGNDGYSLVLRGKNGTDTETIRLPYEQEELLEYLDAEQLPPVLVDLLEKSHVNMFHSGCVIAEIRDFRQCSNRESPGYQSRHILLRPTMQTLISDVNSITSDNHKWTQEDKLLLESQLILATAEPLCLDPSVSVTCTANRLLYNKQKMNTRPMKRSLKRYSWFSQNQQQEVSHCPPPPQLTSLPSSTERKGRKADEHYDLKICKSENCVDMWKHSPCNLDIPSEVDVEEYVKFGESITWEDPQLTIWPDHDLKDDYGFECEAGNYDQNTKMNIMKSLDDPFISGKTQPCTDDEDSDSQIPPCHYSIDDHSDWFLMESMADAECALGQYQELVQKEAQCPATMSHSSSGSASPHRLSLGKEVVSVQSSASGKGVKCCRPPTKLPSSSGAHSSGNSFTPKQASSCFKAPIPSSASEPPCLSWKLSMNPSQAIMPSPAASSPSGSSQTVTATQVMANSAGLNSVSVGGSAGRVQAVVSGSNPVLSSTPAATTPVGINLNGHSALGDPLPNAVPGAAQLGAVQTEAVKPASQETISLVLKDASHLRPLTLLQLPRGSFVLNTLPQQPQQSSQLMPQQPLQQPTTFVPRQPSVHRPQQASASQVQAFSAQPAVVVNLTRLGTFVQSQATLSQRGSAQKKSQQSLPQPRFQFFPAFPQQHQQVYQLRIVQLPAAAVAAVAAPAARSLQPRPQDAGSQSKGKMKLHPKKNDTVHTSYPVLQRPPVVRMELAAGPRAVTLRWAQVAAAHAVDVSHS
ncbi:transcription factor SPT20 homolog [Choloepus didactylus]|uniref:transcription factor SPT20 homolog n=1 Tax=Choloepus didactylus TaxID=27675 RepID=UPI0018A1217D|nr:transcription factor SPT20 homolog [Choloepus didactylus]